MAANDSLFKEPKTVTSTFGLQEGNRFALDLIQDYRVRLFLKHGRVLSNQRLECKSCISQRG
jgi:hypothetical protein